MAQVKKLQGGEKIPSLTLDDLISKLPTNLTSKQEKELRKKYDELQSGISSGKLKFEFNDNTKEYSITGEGADNFQGNEEYVKRNIFTGNLMLNDPKSISSAAAYLYKLSQAPTTSTTSNTGKDITVKSNLTKEKMNFPVFEKAIEQSIGLPNFKYNLTQLKTDPERQQYIMNEYRNVLNKYYEDAAKKSNEFEYDLASADKLKAALDSKNWQNVVTTAQGFKWSPQNYMVSPQELQEIQEEERVNKVNTLVTDAQKVQSDLTARGLSPDLLNVDDPQNPTSLKGYYVAADDWVPKSAGPWFSQLVKDQGLKIQYDPTTQKHRIFKNGVPFDYTVNQGEGRGYSWKNVDGGVELYTPEINQNKFFNSHQFTPGVYDQLNTSVLTPGYEKYAVYSDDKNKLLLRDKIGNEIRLTKSNNGYVDDKGKIIKIAPIIGKFNNQVKDVKIGEELEAYKVEKNEDYRNLLKFAETIINRAPVVTEGTNQYRNFSVNLNSDSLSNLKTYVGKLKYILATSTTLPKEDRDKIIKLIKDTQNGFLALGDKGANYLKKYQDGGAFSQRIAETLEKRKKQLSIVNELSANKPAFFETIGGASGIDKARLATMAGSLVPGVVGAGSNLAYTVLDAIEGSKDGWGWDDTGNLLLNIGLTGASFIGAGGVGSAIRSARAASKFKRGIDFVSKSSKALDKVTDLTKIGNKAAKFEKGEDVTKAIETINQFKGTTLEGKSLREIKALAAADNKTDVVKAIDEVVDFTNKTKGVSIPNAAKLDKLYQKVGTGLAVGSGIMNLGGATDAVKSLIENKGDVFGLTTEEAESLLRVAFAGKTGIGHGQKFIAKKYGTVPTSKSESKLVIKGEEVKDKSLISKFESSKKNKKDFIKDYNKDLPSESKISKEDIKYSEAIEGDKVIRELYSLDKNKTLQWLGKKYATRQQLAPRAPKKVATTPETPTAPVTPEGPVAPTVPPKVKSELKKKAQKVSKSKDTKLKLINPKTNKPYSKSSKTVKREQSLMSSYLKEGGILKLQDGTTSKGLTLFGRKVNFDKAKKVISEIEPSTLGNLAMFFDSRAKNIQSENLQLRALDNIPMTAKLPKVNNPVSFKYLPYAEKQVSELRQVAKDTSKRTSDFDKSSAIMFAGENQGRKILEQAIKADVESVEKQRALQKDLDYKRNTYNLSKYDEDAKNIAQANTKRELISVNRLMADSASNDAFIKNMISEYPKTKYKNLLKSYNILQEDPEYLKLIESYDELTSDENRSKLETDYNNLVTNSNGSYTTPFLQSKIYLDWVSNKDKLEKTLKEKQNPMKKIREELSYLSMYKSGGSVEDKIKLENVKAKHKRKQKEVEMLYKSLLEDRKLLYKSLFNVFK